MPHSLYPGEVLTEAGGRPCGLCTRGQTVARLERWKDGQRLTVHHLCPACLERRYGEGWAGLVKHSGQPSLFGEAS